VCKRVSSAVCKRVAFFTLPSSQRAGTRVPCWPGGGVVIAGGLDARGKERNQLQYVAHVIVRAPGACVADAPSDLQIRVAGVRAGLMRCRCAALLHTACVLLLGVSDWIRALLGSLQAFTPCPIVGGRQVLCVQVTLFMREC
jgi:hypothetical protein